MCDCGISGYNHLALTLLLLLAQPWCFVYSKCKLLTPTYCCIVITQLPIVYVLNSVVLNNSFFSLTIPYWNRISLTMIVSQTAKEFIALTPISECGVYILICLNQLVKSCLS